jgi:hypothetical protein
LVFKIKPRATHILDKHSITELQPSPFWTFYTTNLMLYYLWLDSTSSSTCIEQTIIKDLFTLFVSIFKYSLLMILKERRKKNSR